jgi:glycosyltransferase involved in cell wall biosynthesis
MKIAYFLATYPVRTERFIYAEIEALRRRGVQVSVFALRAGTRTGDLQEMPPAFLRPRLLSGRALLGCLRTVLRHPLGCAAAAGRMLAAAADRPRDLATSLRNVPTLLAFADRVRHEGIAHLHGHFAAIPAVLAAGVARITGLPFSFSAHARDIFVGGAVPRRLLACARFATVCTAHGRDRLLARAGADASPRLHLLYHGLPRDFACDPGHAPRPLPDPEGRAIELLSVGRLVPKKGFPDLLRACAVLASRAVSCRLTIVGDGAERDRLLRLAARSGLRDTVQILPGGDLAALRRRYAGADLLVQASRVARSGDVDGIPNVLLEAMAVGLPVIATTAGGIPELIRSGENGVLVPPGSPEALADAIETLARDLPRREALARRAREILHDRFDADTSARRLLELFESAGRG